MRLAQNNMPENNIQKGIRQRCALPPNLFNRYSEELFREDIDRKNLEVFFKWRKISTLL